MSPLRSSLATAATYAGYAAMAYSVVGAQGVQYAGLAEPPWLAKLREQRWPLLAAFFVLNQLGGGLQNTGAYEVSINGEQVFSKLKEGGVPHLAFLVKEVTAKTGLKPDQNVAAQLGLAL